MAIIRTAIEAKAAAGRVLSNLSNTALIPDMDAAAIKYLVPIVGYNQYADINQKLADNTVLADEETALLTHMRRVVVFHAYLDELGTDNSKITDNGIRSTETANNPRLFGWQYKELKNTLQSKCADAIEVLIRFLWENKDDYGLWRASPEYSSFNRLLIKTGTDFDQHYKLYQPLRTYYAIKHLLRKAQEDFLSKSIGKDLLTWFVETPETNDTEEMYRLLKSAAAYMTIYKACNHFVVRFDSNGFTVVSGDAENTETAGRVKPENVLFEKQQVACEKEALSDIAKAKAEMKIYRGASIDDDFNNAFDAGPLATEEEVTTRDLGNATRKGVFRL